MVAVVAVAGSAVVGLKEAVAPVAPVAVVVPAHSR